MATYAGYHAAGISGGIIATIGLVAPSVIVIILVANLLRKYSKNYKVQTVLGGIRPAVIALIMYAGLQIARLSVTNVLTVLLFAGFWAMIHFWKKSPIFYLCLAAAVGMVLKL